MEFDNRAKILIYIWGRFCKRNVHLWKIYIRRRNDIKSGVYSNTDALEIIINGELYGKKKRCWLGMRNRKKNIIFIRWTDPWFGAVISVSLKCEAFYIFVLQIYICIENIERKKLCPIRDCDCFFGKLLQSNPQSFSLSQESVFSGKMLVLCIPSPMKNRQLINLR